MTNDLDGGETWIGAEINNAGFGETRLGDRLRKLMCCRDSVTGQPLPLACEDRANKKAACRFLSNISVTEEHILAGHFQATARRAASCDATLLVLQDTTEFVYQRSAPDSIGHPLLSLIVIHATEVAPPKGRKPFDWKMLTDLPVGTASEAIEKLACSAMRWKIELFFKILKSHFNAKKLKPGAAEGLADLIDIFCMLDWRIIWLTARNRARPNDAPGSALTATKIMIIHRIPASAGRMAANAPPISSYLTKIARLGGYLDQRHDPSPCDMIMCRG